MKRDMDLVRRICFAVEDLAPNEYLQGLEGVDNEVFAGHVELMADAGLIIGNAGRVLGPSSPLAEALTWAGHDFADAARSDTLWTKAKEVVIRPGASFTFDVLREWLKNEISKGFPTLRS
jgi:hypothetical protein